MKTKLVLFLMLLFTQSAFAASKADIPQSVHDVNPSDVAKALVDGNDKDQNDDLDSDMFYPNLVKEELITVAEQLYSVGIAKPQYVEEYKCRVEQLVKIEEIRADISDSRKKKCYKNFLNKFKNNPCITNATFSTYFTEVDSSESEFHKRYNCQGKTGGLLNTNHKKIIMNLYRDAYAHLIAKFKSQVISNPEFKVGEWQMATVKQCESPFVRLPWVGFEGPGNCVASNGDNNKCTKHGDCCSAYCLKEDGATEGQCLPEMSCFKLLQPQEECGLMPNNRLNPYCDNKEMQYHLNPLPPEQKEHLKPQPGEPLVKCIETNYNTSEIGECTMNGMAPTAQKPCCSDKEKNGKCVFKSTCDYCKMGGMKPAANEKCCPGFYKSLSGVCIQDFPPLNLPIDVKVDHIKLQKKSLIEKMIDIILPSAHAQDGIIEDSSEHSNCVAGVTCSNNLNAEQEEAINSLRQTCLMADENGNQPSQDEINECLTKADKMRNDFINENIKAGTNNDGQWTRSEYLSRFNMTAITAKTASDFKKCEFNSFNDSWRSASNLERNAEIVIRGFEYVFSGKGTQDYWVDKNGLSIYERAKEVAKNVRRYRTDLIKQYQEIDRKMACKCIAIMGPSKFPDKAAFFNTSCAQEKAELANECTGKNAEDGTCLGAADGTSSNQNLNKMEKDQALVGETDVGASGISHEKLLMDYLQMRTDAQFVRFDANAELEEQLTELSQFIIEQNWELSWEKAEPVYGFTIKRTAKWISWVAGIIAAIAAGVLIFVTMGTVLIIAVAVIAAVAVAGVIMNEIAYNNSTDAVAKFTDAAATRSIWASGVERRVYDKVTHDWYTKGFKSYKHFDRQYITPYFKSGDAKDPRRTSPGLPSTLPSDKVCEVWGSSRVCFKNAHATMYEGEPRFLLDVKFPEFVPSNAYEAETPFVAKVNEGFQRGIQALRNECTSCKGGKNRAGRRSAKKAKWLEEDHLSKHEEKFLPDEGKWIAKPFGTKNYSKFEAGVKKYAECIELKKCGAQYLEDDEDAFGFGFLFEKQEDINNFAVYVYQHHFHWPSLSTSGMIAYPTMAMASYFEAMVYNLKLIGSLAAQRGLQMGELYDKYKSDWDKRREDYKLGATAQMGGESKNAKYSKEFRMAFKRLNFKTGVGVDGFQGENGELTGVSGLSESEMKTFENGVQKAMNAKLHAEKSAHYEKTIGQTPRGKIKKGAQQKWMQNFSSPLNKMPLSVGGKQLGMLSKTTNNVVNNYDNDEPQKGAMPTFNTPNYDFGGGFDSSSYGATSQFKAGDEGLPKTGIVPKKVDNSFLLDNAKKNLSMFERDESDSLFKIVSKAYYRNLSLILHRNIGDKPREIKTDLEYKKKKKINKSKKAELKELLGD
jgi:hypothetical protein